MNLLSRLGNNINDNIKIKNKKYKPPWIDNKLYGDCIGAN